MAPRSPTAAPTTRASGPTRRPASPSASAGWRSSTSRRPGTSRWCRAAAATSMRLQRRDLQLPRPARRARRPPAAACRGAATPTPRSCSRRSSAGASSAPLERARRHVRLRPLGPRERARCTWRATGSARSRSTTAAARTALPVRLRAQGAARPIRLRQRRDRPRRARALSCATATCRRPLSIYAASASCRRALADRARAGRRRSAGARSGRTGRPWTRPRARRERPFQGDEREADEQLDGAAARRRAPASMDGRRAARRVPLGRHRLLDRRRADAGAELGRPVRTLHDRLRRGRLRRGAATPRAVAAPPRHRAHRALRHADADALARHPAPAGDLRRAVRRLVADPDRPGRAAGAPRTSPWPLGRRRRRAVRRLHRATWSAAHRWRARRRDARRPRCGRRLAGVAGRPSWPRPAPSTRPAAPEPATGSHKLAGCRQTRDRAVYRACVSRWRDAAAVVLGARDPSDACIATARRAPALGSRSSA